MPSVFTIEGARMSRKRKSSGRFAGMGLGECKPMGKHTKLCKVPKSRKAPTGYTIRSR